MQCFLRRLFFVGDHADADIHGLAQRINAKVDAEAIEAENEATIQVHAVFSIRVQVVPALAVLGDTLQRAVADTDVGVNGFVKGI